MRIGKFRFALRTRKLHCCILRMPNGTTHYLVHLVTAQASRSAPLSWSVVVGLIGRRALAVRRDPALAAASPGHGYVDDPALAIGARPQSGEDKLHVPW